MPLTDTRKELETERLVACSYVQLLSKAEALVPGAGRDVVMPLLWDATAAIVRSEVQSERVVLDGTINCQAVYQQGEENVLRSLCAKSAFSQVIDVPQAQPDMLTKSHVQVESIEVRYENGHVVFVVGLGLCIRVMQLAKIEYVAEIRESEKVETRFIEAEFVKLAAEADETAVMTAELEIPRSLDAGTVLMDWGMVLLDSVQPDLGGVRVKGRVMTEILVSSGMDGRPAVVVKYPMEFDKLIELPEWLAQNAEVCADLRNIRTQIAMDEEGEERKLILQCDVRFSISSHVRERTKLLADAYGTGDVEIMLAKDEIEACADVISGQSIETIRGTVITAEGSPAIGSIIAVRAIPNIAEINCDGAVGKITGLIEADVLYMPVGANHPSTTHTELPFEIAIPRALDKESVVNMRVISAEANALMSDRLEMKIATCIEYESKKYSKWIYVTGMETAEIKKKKSGYIICRPAVDEDEWTLGKRYALPMETIKKAAGDVEITAGKCIVLNA